MRVTVILLGFTASCLVPMNLKQLFPHTSDATRKAMRGNKSQNTKPEMIVRRLVHGLGYRYRLHRKDLPGKPDLVFGSRRKVIFVHGCFWHQHGCKRSSITPKSNVAFWISKLERNKKRDAETQDALHLLGWQSHTIWECELKDLDNLKNRVVAFLNRTY